MAYEAPIRFYYVHLAGITDNVHNGIFLVNNSDRIRIDSGNSDSAVIDFSINHLKNDGVRLLSIHVQETRRHWTGPEDKTSRTKCNCYP